MFSFAAGMLDRSLPEDVLVAVTGTDKENKHPPRDPEFRTPLAPVNKVARARTLSTMKMRDTPRPNRTSLILRNLSPEEG